jgi:DNA-binding response OmpR family regulator
VLLRALVRRPVLGSEDLVMDSLSHSVRCSGHAIDLSPKEFELLEFLMPRRPPRQPVDHR